MILVGFLDSVLYYLLLAWYTKLIEVQIFVHIHKSLSASEFSIHLWFTLHRLCLHQSSCYDLSVLITLFKHMLSTISSIVDPQPQGTSLYFGAGMYQMLGPIFRPYRRNHGSGTLDFDELHGIMGISFIQINILIFPIYPKMTKSGHKCCKYIQ